eukprot:2415642-Amphidinium_carterae.1
MELPLLQEWMQTGKKQLVTAGLVGKTGLESEADYEEAPGLRLLRAREVLAVGRVLQYRSLQKHCMGAQGMRCPYVDLVVEGAYREQSR